MESELKNKLKGTAKSKTIWFGHAIAVLAILQTNLDLFELTKDQYGIIFVVIALATYGLRAITTKPLGEKT